MVWKCKKKRRISWPKHLSRLTENYPAKQAEKTKHLEQQKDQKEDRKQPG